LNCCLSSSISFVILLFHCRAGQPVLPHRLRLSCGPISHPQKVPSKYWVLKVTAGIAKSKTTPTDMTTSLCCAGGAMQSISQSPQETTRQLPNLSADQPQAMQSHHPWRFPSQTENRSFELRSFQYLLQIPV